MPKREQIDPSSPEIRRQAFADALQRYGDEFNQNKLVFRAYDMGKDPFSL
jgi:hypothetical protein